MDSKAASPASEAPFFQAIVRPHRSLSRKGVAIVICCMLLGSLSITCLMVSLGAWPVIGFNGADIALAIFLIWLNMRSASAVEIISLRNDLLEISRTDFRGRQEHVCLAPYWLNITLQERSGTVPKLLLASGGGSTEIARQLGEAQKRDLAAALTRALHHWRNPRFDNPQLRE
jgi:uncharacterized membrane protein